MMKNILLAALTATALMSSVSAMAQTPPPKPPACKDDPNFQQLDFWIGHWDVFSGENGTQKSAEVLVESILDGCGQYELWDSVRGADGRGLTTYDRRTGKWNYFWVAANGSTSNFVGELIDPNQMRFVVEQKQASGKMRLRHWTLFLLPNGRIRELSVGTEDGGATWTTEYDLYWTKK